MGYEPAQNTSSVDHETVYDLLYRKKWPELIDFVHRHRAEVAGDPLLKHAVDLFTRTFTEHFSSLDPAGIEPELEKLFLLHAGGYHRIESDQFEQVIVRLVELNGNRPDAAVGYARHCPENDRCAEILRRHDVRRGVAHGQSDRIALETTQPAEGVDHTMSLFKSKQEEDFFMAVREVFATYLAYPNVALSSLIDFDGVREVLSSDERRFFFLGVVDCVVFDQHRSYRPLYFFELDSVLHDVDERRANDAMKDRILSAAGQQLHRIRVRDRSVGREELAALLTEIGRA